MRETEPECSDCGIHINEIARSDGNGFRHFSVADCRDALIAERNMLREERDALLAQERDPSDEWGHWHLETDDNPHKGIVVWCVADACNPWIAERDALRTRAETAEQAAAEAIQRGADAVAGRVGVESMNIVDGKMELRLATEMAEVFVAQMRTLLDDATGSPVENYLQLSVMDSKTGEKFAMVVQRADKPTPHELRRTAEAERDALQTHLTAAHDALAKVRALPRYTQTVAMVGENSIDAICYADESGDLLKYDDLQRALTPDADMSSVIKLRAALNGATHG